jgi:hypothetical protein
MSALTPKADMCVATTDVRFGPIADIEGNYSITSSAATSSPADIFKPIAAAALILTDVSNLVGLHGKVGRFVAAANALHVRHEVPTALLYGLLERPSMVLLPPKAVRA